MGEGSFAATIAAPKWSRLWRRCAPIVPFIIAAQGVAKRSRQRSTNSRACARSESAHAITRRRSSAGLVSISGLCLACAVLIVLLILALDRAGPVVVYLTAPRGACARDAPRASPGGAGDLRLAVNGRAA